MLLKLKWFFWILKTSDLNKGLSIWLMYLSCDLQFSNTFKSFLGNISYPPFWWYPMLLSPNNFLSWVNPLILFLINEIFHSFPALNGRSVTRCHSIFHFCWIVSAWSAKHEKTGVQHDRRNISFHFRWTVGRSQNPNFYLSETVGRYMNEKLH